MSTNSFPEPSVLQIEAVCEESPDALVRRLTDSILACNGWILGRPASTGVPTLDFEVDAAFCLPIYAALIECGLHLGKRSHIQLTHAWMCARHRKPARRAAILTIQLRMHALSAQLYAGDVPSPGGAAQ